MVVIEDIEQGLRLRLLPNRSASWKQTRYAVALIGGVSLLVAGFWAWHGVWMILPFAGLEVALLAYFAYRVCAETHHQQIIEVREDGIEVQWGQDFPKKRWLLDRYASECVIVKPHHSLSADQLMLRDNNHSLLVGGWLNKEDMDQLICRLKALGLPFRTKGKVTTVAIEGFDL